MKTYPELAAEIAELVELKAKAYGSSHAKCGLFLRLLFPDGIPPNRYTDAMLCARIFDKLSRVANDAGAFEESPWTDLAGYALLGAQLHQKIEDGESCASVSGPAASSQPKEMPASAAPSTSVSTTTSAKGKTAIEPLPQPDGCSETLTSAPATSATEAACRREEDLIQRKLKAVNDLVDLFYPSRVTVTINHDRFPTEFR